MTLRRVEEEETRKPVDGHRTGSHKRGMKNPGEISEARYELLQPDQVVRRRRAMSLAYLPLGTIEWHGQQNPLGVDGLVAHEVCRRAAVRGGGVVFPGLWYGENRESNLAEVNRPISAAVARAMRLPKGNFARGYMGGDTLIGHSVFYQELLWRIYHQIRSLGFQAIYVLVGHGPLKLPAQLTSELFERATGVRMAATLASDLIGMHAPEHAARWETGIMMELRPELVDLQKIAGIPKSNLVGMHGEDPRQGAAELGKKCVKEIVEELAKAGGQLLRRKASDGGMTIA